MGFVSFPIVFLGKKNFVQFPEEWNLKQNFETSSKKEQSRNDQEACHNLVGFEPLIYFDCREDNFITYIIKILNKNIK